MRPANTQRVAALMASLATVLTASSAPAAVWIWACQGELGDQRILFDRDGLYIADGKTTPDKPWKVTSSFSKESIQNAIAAVKTAGGFTEFGPGEGGGGGLESPVTFARTGDDKKEQKVVFSEKSSKRVAHHHRLVQCGSRDEDTDLYLKVYRYQRDGEPARDITMQCMEYQLSTKGGRKGCDFGD